METQHHYQYDFDTSGWDTIQTFDDAIDLNVEFLEGKRKSTPYHAAPIYDVDTTKLIYIHEKGRIITINGQSNECEYDKYYPEKKMIYFHNDRIDDERIIPTRIVSMEQKSYLVGYIERKQLHSFLSFLKHNKGTVAYHVYDIIKDKSYYNRFDKKNMWVTRYKLNGSDWQESTWAHKEPDLHSLYDEFLIRARSPLVYFFIFSIKPCDLNMEDVLISYIDGRRKRKSGKKKSSTKKKKRPSYKGPNVLKRRSLKRS